MFILTLLLVALTLSSVVNVVIGIHTFRCGRKLDILVARQEARLKLVEIMSQ